MIIACYYYYFSHRLRSEYKFMKTAKAQGRKHAVISELCILRFSILRNWTGIFSLIYMRHWSVTDCFAHNLYYICNILLPWSCVFMPSLDAAGPGIESVQKHNLHKILIFWAREWLRAVPHCHELYTHTRERWTDDYPRRYSHLNRLLGNLL